MPRHAVPVLSVLTNIATSCMHYYLQDYHLCVYSYNIFLYKTGIKRASLSEPHTSILIQI